MVHSLNMGGTEALARDMCLALKDEFNLSMICLDEPGLWADELRDAGIPLYSFWRQEGIDIRLIHRLARFARENDVQLFHAHQTTPWFYSGLSRLLHPGTRVLFEEHGRFYPEIYSRKKAFFNRAVLSPLTSCFVAVSEDVKDKLVQYEGVPGHKIRVIYNGKTPAVPPGEKEREAMRASLGIGPLDFLCGTVGRLDPIKNLPMFLKALAEARKTHPQIKGAIIGDGPLYSEISNMAGNLGLKGHLIMPGYRSDADRLVFAFDLFILASFSEGTSMALLEAMSAGVPQAVTDVGGNPEVVKNGETGWLVPSDDHRLLARVLAEAVSDRQRLNNMSQASKKRFLKQFTFKKMIESYRELYLWSKLEAERSKVEVRI